MCGARSCVVFGRSEARGWGKAGSALFPKTFQIQTFEETAMKKRRVEVNKSHMAFNDHIHVLNGLYFHFYFLLMREAQREERETVGELSLIHI